MSSDAIVVLKADHKEIRDLVPQVPSRRGQGGQDERKDRRADHRAAHGAHLYRERGDVSGGLALLPDLKDDVLESYEEHHVADVLCMELAGMPAGAERFDAKATVLIENVTHHIEEEEQDWFPKVREGLGRKQLQELGAKLEQARKKAPRSLPSPAR